MAIFASTTTSGYSDPLKAYSIKALEQRQKDMQAQMAAQQPDAASMATIPGGIGHVLGVVGDRMKEARNDQAMVANRADLAKVMSGYDRDKGMTGEQAAVLSRVAPDVLEKLMGHEQERWKTTTTETAATGRADAQNRTTLENTGLQNTSRENISTAEIGGRANVAKLQEDAANARNIQTTGTQLEIAKLGDTGADRRLGSTHAHEANQLRLKAELDETAQELKYAQENRLQDRTIAAQEKMARLNSELSSAENRKAEEFKGSQLEKTFAQDDKMKGLDRAAVAANLKLELANRSGIAADRIAAEKELAQISSDKEYHRQFLRQTFDIESQKQAETAKSALQEKQITADKETARLAAEAKANELRTDPKRNEAIRSAETDYRKGLSHIENLAEATKILEHPNGIYTGAMQNIAPTASGVPGVNMLVDKEKAQRTARYNTIVGEDAIRDMATTLKGSSTNYEMGEFKKMKNDPNISDQQRAAQLQKVVKAARADLEAQAKEVKNIGGDTERVDRTMRGGGAATPAPTADVPRPAGKNDSQLIEEAKAEMAKHPEHKAAIEAQLQKWMMGK